MINGILNVYKEPGFTSFDVVAKLRGILKQKKIGHTGTLDPDAEGVLVVCLGNATKLSESLTDKDKEYTCTMHLGVTTDTEDCSGKVLETKPVTVTEEQVIQAVYSFLGESMQIPPMYSAIKQNGKKLYELAREGKTVEREPRKIVIYKIEIKEIALPFVTFKVQCSKGTYIRSLCRDIGEKLLCGACMEKLYRNRVSQFLMEDSITLSQIESYMQDNTLQEHINSVESMFPNLAKVTVKKEFEKLIYNGNKFCVHHILENENLKQAIAQNNLFSNDIFVYDTNEKLVGMYYYRPETKEFAPHHMFL